jgi:ubiquinone/menaquinone biosynthesis C-methylase UbiE
MSKQETRCYSDASNYSFGGSLPDMYDQMWKNPVFAPFAADLVSRIPFEKLPKEVKVLELSCGTGICTKELMLRLPPKSSITVTDICAEMLEFAKHAVESTTQDLMSEKQITVQWQVVDDSQSLPYDHNSFDLIVCQHGFPFCSSPAFAFQEAFRILCHKHGTLLFNVWDSLQHNPLFCVTKQALQELYPMEAPVFEEFFSVPSSLHDQAAVQGLLRHAAAICASTCSISSTTHQVQATWLNSSAAAMAVIVASPLAAMLPPGSSVDRTIETVASRLDEEGGFGRIGRGRGKERGVTTSSNNSKALTAKAVDTCFDYQAEGGESSDEVEFSMHAVVHLCCVTSTGS